MPAQERRRLMILGSLLGVLLAVFVAKTFFVSDDEPRSAPSGVAGNPFEPRLNATTTSVRPPRTTKTTKPAKTPTTPSTFQVYGTKNPFEPVIQIESEPTTTTRSRNTTTTSGGGVGTTTSTSAPSNNPGPGQTVTLVDVYRNASGVTKAHVQVGSVVYDVGEGATFADGAYRVVSLDISGGKSCGQFLYGDSAFRLCQGQQTLK